MKHAPRYITTEFEPTSNDIAKVPPLHLPLREYGGDALTKPLLSAVLVHESRRNIRHRLIECFTTPLELSNDVGIDDDMLDTYRQQFDNAQQNYDLYMRSKIAAESLVRLWNSNKAFKKKLLKSVGDINRLPEAIDWYARNAKQLIRHDFVPNAEALRLLELDDVVRDDCVVIEFQQDREKLWRTRFPSHPRIYWRIVPDVDHNGDGGHYHHNHINAFEAHLLSRSCVYIVDLTSGQLQEDLDVFIHHANGWKHRQEQFQCIPDVILVFSKYDVFPAVLAKPTIIRRFQGWKTV